MSRLSRFIYFFTNNGMNKISGDIVSFTAKDAAPLKSLVVNIDPVQAGTGVPSPTNIRAVSGWQVCNVWVKESYDPTSDSSYEIDFPNDAGTVYGGILDVTNGKLIVDRVGVDMGNLTWGYASSVQLFRVSKTYMPYEPKRIPTGQISGQTLCSIYNACNATTASEIPDKSYSLAASTMSSSYDIFLRDSSYSNKDTFKTAMSGQILVYEVATPIEYTLTATEVDTLVGNNTIWADTGNVTVRI